MGLFSAASIYWISIHQVDLSRWRSRPIVVSEETDHRPVPASSVGDEIFFDLDQPGAVNDIRIVYRGTEKGVLHLDLIIPELDRQYAYSYNVPKYEAEQGFSLYGRRFRLTYFHGTRIRLKWIE